MAVDTRLFRRLVHMLRQEFPTLAPVKVRRRKGAAGYGGCAAITQGDRLLHFCVYVDSRLQIGVAGYFLVHEWAHALSWTHDHHSVSDHGIEFALAYSRIYAWFEKCQWGR